MFRTKTHFPLIIRLLLQFCRQNEMSHYCSAQHTHILATIHMNHGWLTVWIMSNNAKKENEITKKKKKCETKLNHLYQHYRWLYIYVTYTHHCNWELSQSVFIILQTYSKCIFQIFFHLSNEKCRLFNFCIEKRMKK